MIQLKGFRRIALHYEFVTCSTGKKKKNTVWRLVTEPRSVYTRPFQYPTLLLLDDWQLPDTTTTAD
jgi:hypothetical protein